MRNQYSEVMKMKKEYRSKLAEATMDGVRYGMLAMEIMMLAYDTRSIEEKKKYIDNMRTDLERMQEEVTKQYIPIKDLIGKIYSEFGEDMGMAEELVEIDPKLGAYF